ncbi:MAG: hypothetical protein RLZZ347_582, partial [Candidatus Parcubacteria bacterium]
MKKVSVFFSKELQGLMDSEPGFKKSNLVKNALALVAFVTETALTGERPKIRFPVFLGGNIHDYLNPKWADVGFLSKMCQVASRLEIHLRSGSVPG